MPICPSGGERARVEGGEEKSNLNSISAIRWKELRDYRFMPLNLQKHLRPCSWELGTVSLELSFVKGLDKWDLSNFSFWEKVRLQGLIQLSLGFGGFLLVLVGFVFGLDFFVLFCFWNKEGVTRQNLNEAAWGDWITCPRAAGPCSRGWVPNHIRLPGITPASSLSSCASLSSVHPASEPPHH